MQSRIQYSLQNILVEHAYLQEFVMVIGFCQMTQGFFLLVSGVNTVIVFSSRYSFQFQNGGDASSNSSHA